MVGSVTAYPEELLRQRWYVVIDDEVGGWAITNVDKPVSEVDLDADERVLADFVHEPIGRYVVDLHNRALRETT